MFHLRLKPLICYLIQVSSKTLKCNQDSKPYTHPVKKTGLSWWTISFYLPIETKLIVFEWFRELDLRTTKYEYFDAKKTLLALIWWSKKHLYIACKILAFEKLISFLRYFNENAHKKYYYLKMSYRKFYKSE